MTSTPTLKRSQRRTTLPSVRRSNNHSTPSCRDSRDLPDYTLASWFETPLAVFQDALKNSFERVRAKKTIAQSEAVQLVWDYLAFQVHLSTNPQAEELFDEDDQSRYITDEPVVIKTKNGAHLSAMLIRPRNPATRLPALLEFTIYPNPANDAKECAARGYVGVVAYTRGKLSRTGKVLPYEYDGDDARTVISWIAKQPWSDGRVGMYGSGYSAFAAWAAAKRPAPALKAIAVASAVAPGIDAPELGNIYLNSAYRWAHNVTDNAAVNEADYDDEAHWRGLNETLVP